VWRSAGARHRSRHPSARDPPPSARPPTSRDELNGVGDAGAAALAAALPRSSLTLLNLSLNAIGDDGACALAVALASGGGAADPAAAPPRPPPTLNLQFNVFGEKGASALAAALRGDGAATNVPGSAPLLVAPAAPGAPPKKPARLVHNPLAVALHGEL
jgi:hypothetical protein